MSRETDTPSSGPNGRGGAAYPSGTPPYGTPKVSDAGADAARSGTQSDDRKTETTLTTRIRINIPGSRPIPPVVVRKPVADADGSATAEDGGRDGAASPSATPPAPTASTPAEPAPPAREKPASDWFAPRKSSGPKALPGGGGGNGAGLAAGSAAGASGPAGAGSAGTPGAGTGGAAPRGGARPGGVVGSMNMPGAVRGGVPTNGAGLPGATGGPVAPGHGGGTGSFDVTEALAASSLGGPRPGQGGTTSDTGRDDLPYFSENGTDGSSGSDGSDGFAGFDDFPPRGGHGGPGGSGGFNGPRGGAGGPGRPQGPAGPTGGPVTGTGPLVPPVGGNALGGNAGGAAGRTAPAGSLADDTAELTPQPPAGGPGIQGFEGFDSYGFPSDNVSGNNVSGNTVTSGIPVVPPGASSPFGPGTRRTPPRLPEPSAQNLPGSQGGQGNQAGQSPQGGQSAAPAGKKAKKAKKGRSKLVLLGGVVVLAGAGVYGAGLLMNHSDVPKGTTVLGVDIGGGTRDDAVKKLDDAFGTRVNQPLKLSVGGRPVSLTPDKAGLQLDTAATVAAAAKSDYNPVSVVGALFGQQRVVDPVMPVDEEKLEAALRSASGGAGSVVEGSIKFESGKAVAVYGKAGKGIDAASSTKAVEEAYRTMVETGTATPVTVPTTTQQPTVSNAEVDREMKDFAKPAMSDRITVQTDAAHSIQFGSLSLPKILGVKAVGGKLVETYDLDALKAAYGSTFDGVQIQTATGKRGVLPQDVVAAMRTALRGTTAAQRIGVIDTSPN